MATIVLRNVKGTPLTFTEMDNNFTNLNSDKLEKFDANTVVNTYAGPYTFTPGSPATDRHEFFAANTGGFESGPHTLRVQFDLLATNYFAQIKAGGTGHIAVILHQDPALVATNVRGNGCLIGICDNGIGEGYPFPTAYNVAMIETWMGGTASTNDNRVFPGTETPPGYEFVDGTTYRFILSSSVDDLDNKWIRMQVFQKNTSIHPEGAWDLVHDTGHHLDFNEWADFTKTGVYFAHVFEPATWTSISISNVNIVWGPMEPLTATERHFRFGTLKNMSMFPTYKAAGAGNTADYTFNMTGWDNSQIRTFATDAWNWNNILDVGDLKAGMISSGMSSTNADAVETWVGRPLYAMVAKILWHMRQRGW